MIDYIDIELNRYLRRFDREDAQDRYVEQRVPEMLAEWRKDIASYEEAIEELYTLEVLDLALMASNQQAIDAELERAFDLAFDKLAEEKAIDEFNTPDDDY